GSNPCSKTPINCYLCPRTNLLPMSPIGRPRAKSQEPRAKSQEPKAESPKPKADSTRPKEPDMLRNGESLNSRPSGSPDRLLKNPTDNAGPAELAEHSWQKDSAGSARSALIGVFQRAAEGLR